mmetsp:Transcript_16210/g.48565  ORF Transcript_16210/g.48565 Transcript_16210/m.48565 type:complete len:391 (-) Transcript_16210:635-1807(-)|eukprot:CAMPEP_0206141310 /NCGR_PEP_ID=MMETSP1473-20131121/12500_1 /ASSEMBLY_ACC=CAM_ASM_001109 /TAXON_ID=1461547 /ORGANISM="Stichococcus sp, Strain RCC1054" /LENGTH=390 /DNA_ID=CAMNT_0053535825 /DNA_START=150 /DNA_END=1322 /DNA_ORIENTATION=+
MPGLPFTGAQHVSVPLEALQQPIKQVKQPKQVQGSVTRQFEPVDGPSAWVAADYRNRTDAWTYHLSDADIAELDTAVANVQHSGVEIQDVARDSVHLPTLGPRLLAIREEIIRGRGFQVIKGVPVERYSRRESLIAYWVIGLWFGKAVSNNKKGHLIGHIKDIGHDPSLPTTRLYATTAAQPFHNDSSDIVGLLCLKNAREGGESSWASSVAVHNEIVRRAPHLARELARRGAWYFDRKGEVPDRSNGLGWFELPVFNYHEGYLSTNYSPNYYFSSQRHPEVPRLTQDQKDAIQLFDELAASPELAMTGRLEPGDIQLLNNHTILHARSAFTDHLEVDEKRHLLRLWLSPENDRPLPSYYAELLGGSIDIGNRGGIQVGGRKLVISEEAE